MSQPLTMLCPPGWCSITSARTLEPAVPCNHQVLPGGRGGGQGPRPWAARTAASGCGPCDGACAGRGNGDILGKMSRLRLQRLQSWENTVHRISSSVDVGPFPLSPCEEEVPFAHESAESRTPQPGKARPRSLGLTTGPPAGDFRPTSREAWPCSSSPSPPGPAGRNRETQRPSLWRGRRGAASAQRGHPSPRCSASPNPMPLL